jgi:membrane protein implicated in regulation of membrane protease activity
MLQLSFWHWLVLGVVLSTIEAFVPGAFFLGMGISALIVGGGLWLLPDTDWKMQLFAFAVLSAVSIIAGRKLLKHHPVVSDQPLLNQRGAQYVGRNFNLHEPIVNGDGKIRVDDSTWRVSGQDAPAGTLVRVTGVSGVVLEVERVENAQ